MPPTAQDLAKYRRIADAYHHPSRGLSLRDLAAKHGVSAMTIKHWLEAVGRPPRARGTHGPAEQARVAARRRRTLKALKKARAIMRAAREEP
jgi:transposase